MLLRGTDANPPFNLPGFDITTDGLQTKYSQQSAGPTSSDSGNNLRDVRRATILFHKQLV
jgi:hypothetical protein